MPDKIMRAKAIRHYEEMSRIMPQYTAVKMAELAPGVIAIKDTFGECDVLFDKKLWDFADPDFRDKKSSPLLDKGGLKVLGGRLATHDIPAMAKVAKEHLVRIGNLKFTWHKRPQFFNHEDTPIIRENYKVRLNASKEDAKIIFAEELKLGETYTVSESQTKVIAPDEVSGDPGGEHTMVRIKENLQWYDLKWFVKI